MTAASIAAAISTGVCLLVAIDLRSPPARVDAPTTRSIGRHGPTSERLGRWLWSGLRRQPHLAGLMGDPTPVSARRLGRLTLVTILAAGVDPLLAVGVVVAGVTFLWVRRPVDPNRPDVDQRSVTTALPDLIDLLVLTTGAGLTVPRSVPVVAGSAPAPLRPALRDFATAQAGGASVEESIEALGAAWGDAGAPLVHVLADHVRYGTPVVAPLERVGASARLRRRRAAEVRARRLPVLLLFPLVLCTLPAFGLLTVAPLVAGTLGSLDVSPFEAPASTTP